MHGGPERGDETSLYLRKVAAEGRGRALSTTGFHKRDEFLLFGHIFGSSVDRTTTVGGREVTIARSFWFS